MSSYVLVWRDDDAGKPTVKTSLPIVAAFRCLHLETVCTECVDQWAADYPYRHGGRAETVNHRKVLAVFAAGRREEMP